MLQTEPAKVRLSVSEAKDRIRRNPYGLNLNDVSSFEPGAAKEVATKHGPVYLNGLRVLTVEDAAELAKYKGPELHLDGLDQISEGAMQEFASRSSRARLYFGLSSLSDGVAEAIGKLRDDVFLNRVTELSLANAQHISTPGSGFMSLDGLTDVSTELASKLVQRRGALSLSGLTKLTKPLAEALTAARHQLWLNGLTDLSPFDANVIASDSRTLYLDGLTALSDETASALARSIALSLNKLAHLTDSVAVILGNMKGRLTLNGVEELSDEAAKSLATYKGSGMELKKPKSLSDSALAALESNDNIKLTT